MATSDADLVARHVKDAWWRESRVVIERCDDRLSEFNTGLRFRQVSLGPSGEHSSFRVEQEINDSATEPFEVLSNSAMEAELVSLHLKDAWWREPRVVLERCDLPAGDVHPGQRSPFRVIQDHSGPAEGHSGSRVEQEVKDLKIEHLAVLCDGVLKAHHLKDARRREPRVVLERCEAGARRMGKAGCQENFAPLDKVGPGKRSFRQRFSGSADKTCSTFARVFSGSSQPTLHQDVEYPTECIICGNVIIRKSGSKNLPHMGSRIVDDHAFDKRAVRQKSSALMKLACDDCLSKRNVTNTYKMIRKKRKLRDLECFKCDRKFASPAELETHEISHYVSCTSCFKSFRNNATLQQHIKNCHTVKTKLHCDICRHSTVRSSDLQAHKMRKHAKNGRFKCRICGGVYFDKSLLMKHLKSVHVPQTQKVLSCDVCSFKTKFKQSLLYHSRTHTDEKPYACEYCLKSFRASSNRGAHIARVHLKIRKYSCEICSYRANDRGKLRSHLLTHTDEKPFRCTLCSYSARRQSHVRVHMGTHTNVKPFRCDQCSYSSITQCGLKAHMCNHHGVEKPFKCSFCEFRDTNSYKLHRHEVRHTKPFKCSSCSLSFMTEVRLRTHTKIHTQRNPLQCPVCEKVFSTSWAADQHQFRIHSGEKRVTHKCQLCEYGTDSVTKLANHLNMHTGERPYKCSLCKREFTQNSHLTTHKSNVHKQQRPFKCELCTSSFSQKKSLTIHSKYHCISTNR